MDCQDPRLTKTDTMGYTVLFNIDVNEIDFYDFFWHFKAVFTGLNPDLPVSVTTYKGFNFPPLCFALSCCFFLVITSSLILALSLPVFLHQTFTHSFFCIYVSLLTVAQRCQTVWRSWGVFSVWGKK